MKITRKLCLTLAAVTVIPIAAFAQENNNALTGGEKGFYSMVSHSAIGAAEEMPDADYSFKPTPDVRSFGQIVGHLAEAQYVFCSTALGEPNPKKEIEKSKTSKTDLVAALKEAVAYCGKAYDMTDVQAGAMTKFFGHDMAKLTVLTINTAHTDEHYGNMVTYLRIKGLVPPTSKGKM